MEVGMKVHRFARGLWELDPPSLSVACKRLRPLAPKLQTENDLKTFIRPSPSSSFSSEDKRHLVPVETLPGGTRWNPTQEQIGILEMLYRGGLRTPNAQQIEQIATQLSKYGKIEGKNVFYWFQNHKARERQKQKRTSLARTAVDNSMVCSSQASSIFHDFRSRRRKGFMMEHEREEDSWLKRKSRSWVVECLEEETTSVNHEEDDEGDGTLELFPLHPEAR